MLSSDILRMRQRVLSSDKALCYLCKIKNKKNNQMNERSIAMQMGEEEKNKIHEDYLLMRTEEEEEEKRGEEEEKGKEEEGEEEKEKEEKMEFEEDDINIVSAKFEKMVI